MSAELVLFWVFAAAIVASAGGVIIARNAIASAMSLVACFFFLAGIYVLLWAHTIAALQVLVYAGAIMVLFLFVIMLLSLTESGPVAQLSPSRILGAVGTAGLLAALVGALLRLPKTLPTWVSDTAQVQRFGTIKEVGQVMYTQWLFPFEAVSLLLLVAIVGAVVVAKPRI
ncbi:MAG: NADH-quinone oxidoreductase subunit J [Myxococcaceae bacterium]|nr:NADH-quinone oxidoreductase subunit J [Myxococcaceae bacterium]